MEIRSIWDGITIPSPLEILEAQKEWMKIKTKGQVIPEVITDENGTRCYFEIGGHRVLNITHSYSPYHCQCRLFFDKGWSDDKKDVIADTALSLTIILKRYFSSISEIIQKKLIPAATVQWALSNTTHNDQPTMPPTIDSLWPEFQEITPLDILKHQAKEAKYLEIIVEEKDDGTGIMYVVTPNGEKIEIFTTTHDDKNLKHFTRSLLVGINEQSNKLRCIAMDTEAKWHHERKQLAMEAAKYIGGGQI